MISSRYWGSHSMNVLYGSGRFLPLPYIVIFIYDYSRRGSNNGEHGMNIVVLILLVLLFVMIIEM